MTYYYAITIIVLLIQAVILLEAWRHVIYTLRKYRPKPSSYHPTVALISPCKGLDTTFDQNINSLFHQDYRRYEIFFIVESTADPAYARLQHILQQQQNPSVKAHLIVAGLAVNCGQKVHNLCAAVDAAHDSFEVFVFADSDTCFKPDFLTSLVYPLRRQDVGASTGYRWYVPTDNRLASMVLSAINAFVAGLMGPHPWNSAWGGAMAIKRDIFEKINLRQMWDNACSDDYCLTTAVKNTGLLIIFVPACFVASYESTSWPELFSFARRQFILTRVAARKLWWLGIFSLGHFLLAFWGGLAVSITLAVSGSPQLSYALVLPAALYLASMAKALMRQGLIRLILPEDRQRLLFPALLDIFFGPILTIFTFTALISAATTRTITWRGTRYILHSIDHTEIIPATTTDQP